MPNSKDLRYIYFAAVLDVTIHIHYDAFGNSKFCTVVKGAVKLDILENDKVLAEDHEEVQAS